ncbi:MAG: Gldg family protein [Kiritimatiellae bacterium]|nr:Gldg family protein [Kiritimatiellia bacterium]
MSVSSVVRSRATRFLRRRKSTAFIMSFFWAVAGVIFTMSLREAAGYALSLPVLWCSGVAKILPFVAAFIGMDLISSERSSGRMDMFLVTQASLKEFVFGRFTALLFLLLQWVLVLLVAEVSLLGILLPEAFAQVRLVSFMPSFAILAIQGALWSAIVIAAGAFTHHAALSCLTAVTLASLLPRALWVAISSFFPKFSCFKSEMIFDVHVADFASGLVSLPAVIGYLILSAYALYVATTRLEMLRFEGVGGRRCRVGATSVLIASSIFIASLVSLSPRFELSLDIPVQSSALQFSSRTINLISETRGNVSAVCFMSRKDPLFRQTSSILRSLASRSRNLGAAKFDISYIDINRDTTMARLYSRNGVVPPAVVFESGNRRSVLQIDGPIDDHQVSSALRDLTLPFARRKVCWLTGHSELSFSDYGPNGMSDIARELVRAGYENVSINLADMLSVLPSEVAFVIVPNAKNDFSRTECSKIDSYLSDGGRLLVLMSDASSGGVCSLLPKWGIRPLKAATTYSRTFTGEDAIVSEFEAHQISSPLLGAQVVFDAPVAFEPSSAAAISQSEASSSNTVVKADNISFTALAKADGNILSAISERGSAVGSDLSLRPTRIVVVGDGSFAVNSQLKFRANANRDFFMNIASYLSGVDSFYDAPENACGLLPTLDVLRVSRFMIGSALGFPLISLIVMLLFISWRKHR